MLFDMLEYCRMIEKYHLNVIYSGPLWADEIEGIAEVLKRRMKFDDLPLSSSQAVFSVFVEQVNNICSGCVISYKVIFQSSRLIVS